MTHTCHAQGCAVECKPQLLMCPAHWRLVPRPVQLRVWANYRVGQCDDKRPSVEWCREADVAVKAVALCEFKEFDEKRSFLKSFHPGVAR